MSFVKGAAVGMIAGAIVGVANSNYIKGMLNKGKRQLKHYQKKFGF